MPGGVNDQININFILGATGGENPFATGHLQVVSDGASGSLLQLDADGVGGDWVTILHLTSTLPGDLTYRNFVGSAHARCVSPIDDDNVGHNVFGTPSNDTISGHGGDDGLYGGRGNDTLHGDEGNDYLQGDQGNDTLYGDAGNDTFADITGSNTAYGGDGSDTFQNVGYGAGADTLTGGADADTYILNWVAGSVTDLYH